MLWKFDKWQSLRVYLTKVQLNSILICVYNSSLINPILLGVGKFAPLSVNLATFQRWYFLNMHYFKPIKLILENFDLSVALNILQIRVSFAPLPPPKPNRFVCKEGLSGKRDLVNRWQFIIMFSFCTRTEPRFHR